MVGRFGNKLFIVAALLGLAKENNDEVVLTEHENNYWKFGEVFENQLLVAKVDELKRQISSVYQEPEFKYNKIPSLQRRAQAC